MRMSRIASQINRYRVASLLFHIGVLVGIGTLLRHVATTRTAVSPKSQTAQRLVLSLPGSVEAGSPKAKLKDLAKPKPKQASLSAPPVPPHEGRLSQTPQTGEGAAGHSAWAKARSRLRTRSSFHTRHRTCPRCGRGLRVT